ncbi:MAG: hypothetical protein FRC54_00070 [bacterium LCO1.1]|uniref:Uncharacterized protein n=1 Tax=Candidatus Weimeria bifida TaxID=2599074 RepID=A0A6N7IVW6_9FIRM|nr:hypothetical protein [Candidatus Weimeria bifida]
MFDAVKVASVHPITTRARHSGRGDYSWKAQQLQQKAIVKLTADQNKKGTSYSQDFGPKASRMKQAEGAVESEAMGRS